ncbi:MAG TPA: ATP-binding cassette domain-containing protein, partial [Longimicrobiales bacterium]
VLLQPGVGGEIRFREVDFGYAPHAPVFRGLSLAFQGGAITALVGESGCGKSTLAALVQRLYPIQAGAIEIDGVDIRQIAPESLRRAVGLVPQRIDLFTGTLAENVAAGDARPDMRRILALGRSLGLEPLLARLPGGWEAHLGENGAALSGGERQRLAIARALYRDPGILFLDEATSALDAHAEAVVRRIAREYRDAGRTVVVIAHRLTTAADADQILVLGDGRVLEEGNHTLLLRTGGPYARLWQAQMGAPACTGS